LLYDTTLRDGCQAEDVSFTLEDKLRIAAKLDELASITSKAVIPAPTSATPIFSARQKTQAQERQGGSFGTTMKVGIKPSQDFNLRVLLEADTRW